MAYKEQLTLKANGLHTYSDSVGSVPEGSLSTASNVVLDKNNLISPRRGFETVPGTITGVIGSLFSYRRDATNEYLLAHRDNTTISKYDDGSETWSDFAGTYAPPAGAQRIRTVESNKNIYFATDKGVQKLDSIDGELIDAGAPEGLDIVLETVVSPGEAVEDTMAVAYRVVFGYKDANENLVLGAPSSPLTYWNQTGGTVNPTIKATLPTPPIDEVWFVQLYRTANSVVVASQPAPGDDMQLVFEANPTPTDLSNGYIELTDPTVDDLRGADLYTNATQEGILAANFTPPQCVDMALFQNHMFYANTQTKYQFEMALLAAEGSGSDPTEFKYDDTITVAGITFTGKAVSNVGNNEFEVGDGSTISQNIETTARSFVEVFNNSASNTTMWAVYDSGADDLPGKIRILERDFNDQPDFSVSSSVGAAFSPNLDVANAEQATNDKRPNRLFYSKFQEPEAVPILNFFDVGAANNSILRILPLRSTLLVFTDAGIYRLTGTTSATFQVTLLDVTAKLIAPESLVALNNVAVGLFDQGVSNISGSSVQIISRPIEGKLRELQGATGDTLVEEAFGISYESDRKYLLSVPQDATDTSNTIMYVYNTITNSWTTYDLAKTAGIVRKSDDKLYLAEEDKVSVERKNFNDTDFSEEAIPVTATAVSLDKFTITLNTIEGVEEGYLYYESASSFSLITAVDTLNSTITVEDSLEWELVDAEARPYIVTELVWNPISAKTPNMLKQFAECTLLVEKPLSFAELEFKTSLSGDFEGSIISDSSIGLWGLFPWGEVPWGGGPERVRYRTYVPRSKQKDAYIFVRLSQNTVFNGFEVSGLSLYYRNISNRTGR